jgi:hypothetical protein
LNLIPKDIGLVVGLGPHESQFAIRNCSVAMVYKALFRHDKITGARNRYQANDGKNLQSFLHFFSHKTLGQRCVQH